jgi:folylpolyglutamate synthase/dihydropteroate synthase
LIGEGDVQWQTVLGLCEAVGGTQWYVIEQESYAYPPWNVSTAACKTCAPSVAKHALHCVVAGVCPRRSFLYYQRNKLWRQPPIKNIDYLYRYIPVPTHRADPAENLTRTRELLDALGSPDARLRSVVVAGTKGKGSTSASDCQYGAGGGLQVGLWTSPHLHSYRERIQINGELISQAALIAAVNQIVPFVSTLELTAGLPATFAIGFAIAMRYFADQKVDLVVVEVGLGGRFDSANVLTPLLSVVTSISYDHMELLGDTIDAIAMQKGALPSHACPC